MRETDDGIMMETVHNHAPIFLTTTLIIDFLVSELVTHLEKSFHLLAKSSQGFSSIGKVV
jgi:hypothetical protein